MENTLKTHSSLKMMLGEEIRMFRKNKGITQNELSAKTGLSQAFISDLENNKREPSLGTLGQISKVLGVPLPLMLVSLVDENTISPEKREFWDAFKGLIKNQFSEKS